MENDNDNVPIDHLGSDMLIPAMEPWKIQAILDDEEICECCKAGMLDPENRQKYFGLKVPGRPDLTALKKRVLQFGGERFQRIAECIQSVWIFLPHALFAPTH